MRNLTALVFAPAALLVIIGCDLASLDPGGGAVSETVVSVRGEVAAPDIIIDDKLPPIPPGPPGSITGVILLEGAFSGLPSLVPKGSSKVDPAVCAKTSSIPDESLVVGKDGGIANVFVYLKKLPRELKGTFEKPTSQPLLDQVGCIFKPRALLLWVGLEYELKNSDAVSHNVKTTPGINDSTNGGVAPGESMFQKYRRVESQPFIAQCSIHPWMQFWTLVLDHPYAAITDANGKFEIANLPPGRYEFRVFHERGKFLSTGVKVVVQAETATKVEWKYSVDKFIKK